MEIKIEYSVYPKSGTKGVCCRAYLGDGTEPTIVNEYNLHKLSSCYSFSFSTFLVENGKIKQELGIGCKLTVDSDIVQDPKNISDEDYQLLKILNPNVTTAQFNIFKELKLYLDNYQTEDYTLDQVKQILKDKENKSGSELSKTVY